MKNKTGEIKVRNVPYSIIKRIDEMAYPKSRQEFLLELLVSIATKGYTNDIQSKYSELLSLALAVIDKNSSKLDYIDNKLNEVLDYNKEALNNG